MQIVIGAVIFAVGAIFGAALYSAGQQTQRDRAGRKIQDAILKNLQKTGDGSKSNY